MKNENLFSLGKQRLKGDMTTPDKYIKCFNIMVGGGENF